MGDPDNQRLDKWSSAIHKVRAAVANGDHMQIEVSPVDSADLGKQ
jgi:hypothetical protein